MSRRSKLIAAILVVCLALGGTLLLILVAIRRESRWHQCYTYMKNVGLAIQMYAMDSDGGLFPELSREPGRLFWSNRAACNPSPVFPDYLSDLSILICPSRRAENLDVLSELSDIRVMDDHSCFYLGYAIQSQQELEAFARAYRAQIAEETGFSSDLEANLPSGSVTLRRLAINPNLDSEENAKTPLLIERPGHHASPGGNVLYFDGHVNFVPEGIWPYTKDALAVFNQLDSQ